MRTTLVILVVLLIVAGSVMAETSVMQRTDMVGGGDPSYTFGIFTDSGLEFWGLGLPDYPDYEVGKTWELSALSTDKRKIYMSAYAVVWPKAEPHDQYFLLPWPSASWQVGKAEVKADLYAYIPVNGGPLCIGTNDTGITWPVGKGRLGISATDWKQEGCDHVWGVGLAGSHPLGKGLSVSGRYIPAFAGSAESVRFQLNASF